MENIGEKIYSLRKEKGVSQEKLAEEVNVARQTVSKWERDIAQPTMENIKSLCVYFGADLNYFLSDEEIAEMKEEAAEQAVAVTQAEVEKTPKFKTLKIVSTVVGMVLLALFIIACGIALYVTIAPGSGGAWGQDKHIINYEGIILFVVVIILVAVLITLITLFISKHFKNKKNK